MSYSPTQKGEDPNEHRYRLLDKALDAILSGCGQSLTARHEPASSKASRESPGFSEHQMELAAALGKVQDALALWARDRPNITKVVLVELLKFKHPRPRLGRKPEPGDPPFVPEAKIYDFHSPEASAWFKATGIDGRGDQCNALMGIYRGFVKCL